MRARLWLSTLLCSLTFACSNQDKNNTEIAVVVWSDLAAPEEMDNIRIDIKGATDTRSISFPMTANSMPLQLSLVPPDNRNEAFDIKATGLLGGTLIVSQEASLSFLPGERRVMTLFLGRVCSGVSCDSGATCFAGTCKSAAVSPNSLPLYDPHHLPSPPDAGVNSPVDGGTGDNGGAEPGDVDAGAEKVQSVDSADDGAVDVAVFTPYGGVDRGGNGGNFGTGGVEVGGNGGNSGTGGVGGDGGAGGATSAGGIGPGGRGGGGGTGGSGVIVTVGTGGATGLDAGLDTPSPQSDVPLTAPDTADVAMADTADVATCVANAGAACGNCGGTITCSGECSIPTPTNFGTACGSCGGQITCSGSCGVPTPSNYGTACGSCGGQITCLGSCSVPTPSNLGTACGSCGGQITCSGSCSVPTPSNLGAACGSCGGQITCSGSCSTPSNYGSGCGSCGGTIQCDGTCSVATPANWGQACNVGTGLGACSNGGTITCDATCQPVTSGFGDATVWHSSAAPNGSWDWDCDGMVTKQYPDHYFMPCESQGGDCTAVVWMTLQSGSNDCGHGFFYTSGTCDYGTYPMCKSNHYTALGDATQQCR